MKRILRWIRAHPWKSAAIGVGLLTVAANAIAAMHAWSFTHYDDGGDRTARPEALSFWERAGVLIAGPTVPRPENAAASFETHRFGGLEAWRRPCADSRGTVILFHGYGGCKSHLMTAADGFAELGYETFLVDFRGSGGSEGRASSLGWHEADDVAAAYAYVRDTLRRPRIILFGESMGAAAVMRATAVHTLEPAALIVASPFDRLATTVEHRFDAMGAPSLPAATLLLFWGSVWRGFWAWDHNPVEYAARIRVPTLFMYGAADSTITVEESMSVFDALAGPKTAERFDRSAHESLMNSDPERWRRAVGAFLN